VKGIVETVAKDLESIIQLFHPISSHSGLLHAHHAGICSTKTLLESTPAPFFSATARLVMQHIDYGCSNLSPAASVDNWDRVFSTNARGTFLCCKVAGRQMIKQDRGGRISSAASVADKRAWGDFFLRLWDNFTSYSFVIG